MESKELREYRNRIDEISFYLDDENLPDDIHDSLLDELDEIIDRLEKELKLTKIREIGLRLVD